MKKLFMIMALMSATVVHASNNENIIDDLANMWCHYRTMPHPTITGTFKADGVDIALDLSNLTTNSEINTTREYHKESLKKLGVTSELAFKTLSTPSQCRDDHNADLGLLYAVVDIKIKPLKCELKPGTSKATLKNYLDIIEKDSMSSVYVYIDAVINQRQEEDLMFKRLVIMHRCLTLVEELNKTLN